MVILKNIARPLAIVLLGKYYYLTKRRLLDSRLTVFCYHDVSDSPCEFSIKYGLNVSPDIFEYQISFIKNNFNIIGPKALLAGKVPEKAAMITFDDGFKSYFTHAVPILEKHHMPSLIFLNMEPVQGGIFWSGLITYLCLRREFIRYLKNKTDMRDGYPPFLYCSRVLVEEYLRDNNLDLESQVGDFVGAFATSDDLNRASVNPLVFYGNHLFNHEVPQLMSDGQFMASFEKNEAQLKCYANYCNMFSLPFGQPGSCYSDRHIVLLREKTKKVFASSGSINRCAGDFFLDRVALSAEDDIPSKIWFTVCRNIK